MPFPRIMAYNLCLIFSWSLLKGDRIIEFPYWRNVNEAFNPSIYDSNTQTSTRRHGCSSPWFCILDYKTIFWREKNRLKYVEFSAIEKIRDCILSQLYSVITKLPERLILNILILKYTDLSFLHSRKTSISLSQIPLL